VNDLAAIVKNFKPLEKIIDIREFGSGNINDTFRVTLDTEADRYFILQRINTHVFVEPKAVMSNIRIAMEHIHRKAEDVRCKTERRWEMPEVFLTEEKKDHVLGTDGSFWRAMSFIENAESFDNIQNSEHAREAGFALGMFHAMLSDLDPNTLVDTLEGFHITPRYIRHFDRVLAKHNPSRSPEIDYCITAIDRRRKRTGVIEDARARGKLHFRPTHGDPKVNNVMMDKNTGHAVSIVDLDTVKTSLVHYDIGDCLRSACNLKGEETGSWETVRFNTDLCRDILEGYLSMATEFLTMSDYDYMYDAVHLIAFELGLRYFTDYLEGNVYFKNRTPEHNLTRALVQFKLTESIEHREKEIQAIVREMRPKG